MLAGEPFTDHPDSVCPVVAGFLPSYNDGVGDDHRDDLCRFASDAVGTRGGAKVTAGADRARQSVSPGRGPGRRATAAAP
jgi:hypothetical protein